jgi:subtilisin family serine protease
MEGSLINRRLITVSRYQPRRAGRPKLLRYEQLETRNLMAAEGIPEAVMFDPPGQPSRITDWIPLGEAAVETELQTLQFHAANSDAGSTRSTAHDLGSIQRDGSQLIADRMLAGSLSYFDRMDVFRFSLSEDANLELLLNGMRRNADLVLANSDGRGIAVSRHARSSNESVHIELSAGIYYVAIQARSPWGTSYRLDLSATFSAPTLPPTVAPEGAKDGNENQDSHEAFADVPYFGSQRDWNINAVNAPEAWAAGFSGDGVIVAVLDTGVDFDHPDLASNIFVNVGEIPGNGIDDDQNGFVDDIHGYDFAGDDADPTDGNGHGTHVAGTIASLNNGFGSTGIAPDATILPVKVLSDSGSGRNVNVAAGIRYAADLGAQVINLSLGGGYSRAVHIAISYANSLGCLVVAAAGNEGAGVPSFPAQLGSTLTNVLSVGAHDVGHRTPGFSNRVGASGVFQIDAPGVGVYSSYSHNRFRSLSGTSMANPHVAGVAALALSANPGLTPIELRDLLLSGVTTMAVGSDSRGIVNAATTVAYAAAGITASATAHQAAASFAEKARATGATSVAFPICLVTASPYSRGNFKSHRAVESLRKEMGPTILPLHRNGSFASDFNTATEVALESDLVFAALGETTDDELEHEPFIFRLSDFEGSHFGRHSSQNLARVA